jgi:hypothetical protein
VPKGILTQKMPFDWTWSNVISIDFLSSILKQKVEFILNLFMIKKG